MLTTAYSHTTHELGRSVVTYIRLVVMAKCPKVHDNTW